MPPDFDISKSGARAIAADIRAQGHASVDGRYIPGLVAAAAPVLDWQGEAQAVVTLIGTQPENVAPESPPIAALRAFCKDHSLD